MKRRMDLCLSQMTNARVVRERLTRIAAVNPNKSRFAIEAPFGSELKGGPDNRTRLFFSLSIFETQDRLIFAGNGRSI